MYRQVQVRILASFLAFTLWDDRYNNAFNLPKGVLKPTLSLLHGETLLITDKFRNLRDDYKPPKYPIVLCHGLSGFDTMTLLQFPQIKTFESAETPEKNLEKVAEDMTSKLSIMVNYWHGIEEALTKAGATVITAKVPPFGTISDRAALLDKLLREKLKDFPTDAADGRVKVNVVGHSMGGLDARYLISKLQDADSPFRVVSLTTVSTPHRGSEVADFVMSLVEKEQIFLAICPRAIPQLTTSFMRDFNETVPNDPSVSYFSYGARMRPSGFKVFRATYEILKWEITKNEGTCVDNDGMVSVELSKWGKYVGTLDDVDHLDLINWTNRMKATVDQAMFQKPPSFNPIALYLDIADMLSSNGF